jgi:hypothetical protein
MKKLPLFKILIFTLTLLLSGSKINAATCSDETNNFCRLPGCPNGNLAGKFHLS